MYWCLHLEMARRRAVEPAGAAEDFWRRIGFAPDVKQRELIDADSRRVILNCTRQWGKSTLTAALAVKRAHEQAESLTLVLSPSARQSGEFLRKAKSFARRLGERCPGDGTNELSARFANGSRIIGLPGKEDTVRGFSAVGLLLIDEAARVSDELYRAVRPMLAVSDGDLWLMSTPWGKRGFFYDEWTAGGAEWTRVSAPATECARISPDFLEGERRSMGERWFRQEYLCEFGQAEDAVFRTEDIESMLDADVEALAIPPFQSKRWEVDHVDAR